MQLTAKSFRSPDESRAFDHGRVDVVALGGHSVSRMTFEPGWRWSEHVRPLAGTDTCQVTHVGYILQGRLAVLTDDGVEAVARPGQVVFVPAGHDGWVVGQEACVMLDWGGEDYASPRARTGG